MTTENERKHDFITGFGDEMDLISGLMVRPELIPQVANLGLTKDHFCGKLTSTAWDSMSSRAKTGRIIEAPWLMHELERRKIAKKQRDDLMTAVASAPSTDPSFIKGIAKRAMLTSHFKEREKLLQEASTNATLSPRDFRGLLEELMVHEESNDVEPTFFTKSRPVLPDMIAGDQFNPEDDEEHLIGNGLLLRKGVTLLTGPSKAGKSYCALEIARCLVKGDSFLGIANVEEKGLKVCYVQAEISNPQVNARLHQLALKVPRFFLQPVPKDTFYLNRTKKAGYGGEQAAGNVAALLKFVENVKARGLDVLIFDPTYKMLDGSELGECEMKSLFDTLEQIAEWCNCGVVLVHHNRKSRMGDQASGELSSGHSVLHRAPVAIITMTNQRDDRRNDKRVQMTFELRCAAPISEYEFKHEGDKMWAVPWATGTSMDVFEYVKDQAGLEVQCKDVTNALKIPNNTVWNALKKLAKNGDLTYKKPFYRYDGPQG